MKLYAVPDVFTIQTQTKMGRLKSYKGIELENKDGLRIVSNERFTTLNLSNRGFRGVVVYRIKGNTSEFNNWYEAAEIKERIDMALQGYKPYMWVLETLKKK